MLHAPTADGTAVTLCIMFCNLEHDGVSGRVSSCRHHHESFAPLITYAAWILDLLTCHSIPFALAAAWFALRSRTSRTTHLTHHAPTALVQPRCCNVFTCRHRVTIVSARHLLSLGRGAAAMGRRPTGTAMASGGSA